MLVLSRKMYERIRIQFPGGECWISVVGIRGDKVRLGFEADKSVQIMREEVLNKTGRESNDADDDKPSGSGAMGLYERGVPPGPEHQPI